MSDILTKWNVADIQRAVRSELTDRRQDVAIRNVSWGFFKGFEVDLLTVSRSDYIHDWEIKRSWSDFVADFKKKHFHDDVRIKHLTYVLPDCLAGEKLKTWCEENYGKFKREFDFVFYSSEGAVCHIHPPKTPLNLPPYYREPNHPYCTEDYIKQEMLEVIRRNDVAERYRRKLFLEEKLGLFRLAAIKSF